MSDHAAIVRKAHDDAMMALAADVHPYTQSSIDAHEQAMDAALDALVAERDEAAREQEFYEKEYRVLSRECEVVWAAADARAEAAEAERDEAREKLMDMHTWGTQPKPRLYPWAQRERSLKVKARTAEAEVARLRETATKVADAYTAEAEDHNDGEFALWKADDLVNAIVALRAALAAPTVKPLRPTRGLF